MTWGATAVGAQIVGGVISGNQAASAQRDANTANVTLTREQLAEQGRQFDVGLESSLLAEERGGERELSRRERENQINLMLQGRFDEFSGGVQAGLDPFQQAGAGAVTEQQALLGLSGPEAETEALARFSESPGQAFLRERQERALLRNTAAIGGLGGGNVRTALQEQAFGRAQTNLQDRVSQLGTLGAQGLGATQIQAGLGAGPAPILTGTDVGVASTPASSALAETGPTFAEAKSAEATRKAAERQALIDRVF